MRSKLIHFSDLNSDKICFEKSLMDGETNSENRQKVLKILMNVSRRMTLPTDSAIAFLSIILTEKR